MRHFFYWKRTLSHNEEKIYKGDDRRLQKSFFSLTLGRVSYHLNRQSESPSYYATNWSNLLTATPLPALPPLRPPHPFVPRRWLSAVAVAATTEAIRSFRAKRYADREQRGITEKDKSRSVDTKHIERTNETEPPKINLYEFMIVVYKNCEKKLFVCLFVWRMDKMKESTELDKIVLQSSAATIFIRFS